MQSVRCKYHKFLPLLLMASITMFAEEASAQDKPPVSQDYQRFFVHYADKRSILDKALNLIKVEKKDIGRSFAIIAGVSQYPDMPPTQKILKPAAIDIEKLQEYLKIYEFFDEIVVLKDGDVNLDNLQFFLQTYFPERLSKFPKSRFLFAYSGHGMTEWPKGYLLRNSARNLNDKQNSINLDIIRVFVDEVTSKGHHVLILINACYSGAFLKRGTPFGGSRNFIPKNPGSHAITAGGTGELTWHIPQVGKGSVFYEKIFAGLDGHADTSPTDGVINVFELFTYLRREVQISTDQEQNPQLGDISKHGSKGEFFFLNRDRQVREGVLQIWNVSSGTPYGENAAIKLNKGKVNFNAENFSMALTYFHQAAEEGYGEAMNYLGHMYQHGLGTEPDLAKAKLWFHKGANAGDQTAMLNLALLYMDEADVSKDYSTAAHYLKNAANVGSPEAMVLLADYYREGKGVPKDNEAALRWTKRGGEAGVRAGMLWAGYMYKNGIGVPKNSIEARRWYGKAALAGSTDAAKWVEEMDYDQIAKELLEQFNNEYRFNVTLTKKQFVALKVILKEHGVYWGQVYIGLGASGVGLTLEETEESRRRALLLLDAAAQVWTGRNVKSRMQGKSANDSMKEYANIILMKGSASPLPLYDDSISWIRQQVLNRPELYILDEFPGDGPKLPPLY